MTESDATQQAPVGAGERMRALLRDLVAGSLRFSDEDSEAIRKGVTGRPPVTFSFGPSGSHSH